MPSADNLGASLSAKRQEHGAWLASKKTDDGYKMNAEEVGEFNTRNEELTKLQDEFDLVRAVEKSASDNELKLAPQGRLIKDSGDAEVKDAPGIQTKGQLDAALNKGFTEARFSEYNLDDSPKRFTIPASFKTVVSLGTSYITQPNQHGQRESALWYGDAEPYFPHGDTDAAAVVSYIQTTDTDNAAFVAEVTAATDSAFVWTPVTDEVEDVQTWIPVSRNLLSDMPQMRSVITNMLAKRLQKVVSNKILNGSGTTPIIWGVFVRTGFQTQAKGADPTFDAVHKAITKVMVTADAEPNLAAFHPNDWEEIRLTRTTDGIYILGNPVEAGPMRIWGLPVVVSTGMTEGTGGVVDTSYTTIFENGGLTVEVSTEHSTFFTERKMAISLVRRLAAVHYRPSAACTVTGI